MKLFQITSFIFGLILLGVGLMYGTMSRDNDNPWDGLMVQYAQGETTQWTRLSVTGQAVDVYNFPEDRVSYGRIDFDVNQAGNWMAVYIRAANPDYDNRGEITIIETHPPYTQESIVGVDGTINSSIVWHPTRESFLLVEVDPKLGYDTGYLTIMSIDGEVQFRHRIGDESGSGYLWRIGWHNERTVVYRNHLETHQHFINVETGDAWSEPVGRRREPFESPVEPLLILPFNMPNSTQNAVRINRILTEDNSRLVFEPYQEPIPIPQHSLLRAATWSRDGNLLIFIVADTSDLIARYYLLLYDLVTQQQSILLESLDELELAATQIDSVVSPDKRWLGYFAEDLSGETSFNIISLATDTPNRQIITNLRPLYDMQWVRTPEMHPRANRLVMLGFIFLGLSCGVEAMKSFARFSN